MNSVPVGLQSGLLHIIAYSWICLRICAYLFFRVLPPRAEQAQQGAGHIGGSDSAWRRQVGGPDTVTSNGQSPEPAALPVQPTP